MLFGELVQRDRERAGLTQDLFVEKLNKVKTRPADPFTKKPKSAHRSWIAKVESGALQRDLRVEVREWLATTLGGDVDAYRTLPLSAEARKDSGDLLKEQEDFLRDALARFDAGSQIQIDAPASGPLSNQRPHLLLLLAGIITKHDSELIIFSNEPAPAGRHPANTMQCVMLLHLLVGELAKDSGANDEDSLRKYFAELDWGEDIAPATKRIFEAARRSRYDDDVKLPKLVLTWIQNHLTVHILKAPPATTDRYNPLTIVLAESVSSPKQSGCILDAQGTSSDLADSSAVAKAFDERRVLFKSFRPSFDEVSEHAALFGLKLEAVK